MRDIKQHYKHFEQDLDDLNKRVYAYFHELKLEDDIDLTPLKLVIYDDYRTTTYINGINTNPHSNNIITETSNNYSLHDLPLNFLCCIAQYISMILYNQEMKEELESATDKFSIRFYTKAVNSSTIHIEEFVAKYLRC